ncbi:MAG: elongation factor P hydroxylase [Candidatus Azotimanducaceae bacterium]|jgi:elongation factor P hydroxylase
MWNPDVLPAQVVQVAQVLQADQVVSVFSDCFLMTHQTRLVGGANEPFYQAGVDGSCRIHFCYDYISSALHEVAHWCIAGPHRRGLDDYGYWYQGERNAHQQRGFEQVEINPQALEWIFSEALGIRFRVSADNLALQNDDSVPFRLAVRDAAMQKVARGLSGRASRFAAGLSSLSRLWRQEQGLGPDTSYDRIELYQKLPD